MAFFTVLYQVAIMFILMMVGLGLNKGGIFDEYVCRKLNRFLLFVLSPVVIVYSFQMDYNPALLRGLLISAASGFCAHLGVIFLTRLVFNRRTVDDEHRNILRYAVIYSNCGFVGIPLLSAVVGTRGIFYASVYMAIFNIFNWTHGVTMFSGVHTRKDLLKSVLNPNIFAIVIGLVCFLTSWRFPPLINDSLHYIFNLNTPLAMLVIGGLAAQLNFRTLFADKWIWPGLIGRNLVVPLLAVFILHLFGVTGVLLFACLVPIACPVAGNTVLLADLFGTDTRFSSKLMSLSTLLSVVTIPMILFVVYVLKF